MERKRERALESFDPAHIGEWVQSVHNRNQTLELFYVELTWIKYHRVKESRYCNVFVM